MVGSMSGEPNQNGETSGTVEADGAGADSGVFPVEVEAPAVPEAAADSAATTPVVSVVDAKIAALEKEKKDNWDRYLRAAADLENLRKRQKREIEDTKYDTKGKVLKEMLPVVDNLERAIEHAAASATAAGEDKSPIVE